MSTETNSRLMARAVRKPASLAALLVCSVLGVMQGSCGTPQVSTPSRSLDRPSDAALFCVDYELDYEGNTCLPQIGDPERDPESYLTTWCNGTSWRDITPKATVLSLQECDESHRRLRTEAYFAKVRSAARALGRDPDWPCCPADNPSCGTAAPACLRRSLSMVIANTARGELAVGNTNAQTPGLTTRGRLQNLHAGQPGFGFLPTGLLPEHVRTFSPAETRLPDGRVASPNAWAVTSNVGSCDVSVVQLQAVADLTRRADSCDDQDHACSTQRCSAGSCPRQWQPWFQNSSGSPTPLSARPGWIEVAPWASPTSRPVLIAYPTCGLVAVVNLDDPRAGGAQPGRITEAIGFDLADAAKAPHVLTPAELAALQCPADCGNDSAMLMPDPATLPAGGAMRAVRYPATLAVDTEGHRLLVGDQVGSSLTVVDLDLEAGLGGHLIGVPRQVPLDFVSRNSVLRSGRPGIDVIRVAPRSEAGRFAYVTARDSTVRVIDLDREVECETNPDPRYLMQNAGGKLRVLPDELNESNLRRLSCIPVSPTTPRRPLAATPGIIMPNGSVPTDIGFSHIDALPCQNTDPTQCTFWPTAPQTNWLRADGSVWLGDYGWILGGGGAVLGIQLADSCPQPSYRSCFADCGAQRRLALLHTRSQELPSPEQYNLPALLQARLLSPQDRLNNVRRNNSRFEDQGNLPAGPYVDSDGQGLPIYAAQIAGAFTAPYNDVPGPAGSNLTRRLLPLPTLAPYYYLPVDPVCDAAIGPQALDLARPDGVLPAEPTRRPVTVAAFTDPLSATSELWSLVWEGRLSDQLARTSGRLLSTGQLVDVNGLYCSRGVEVKDKLWLTGCLSNNDCPVGTLCRLEQLQGTAPGVCLANDNAAQCRVLSQQLMLDTSSDSEWATTWVRRYRITKAQQQVPVVTAGTDVVDALTLDEIAEPEFDLERKDCKLAELGSKCDHYQAWVLPRHSAATTPLAAHEAYCRVTGLSSAGTPVTSCIMQCASNTDCGDGFVCTRSAYEKYEAGNPNIKVPGRCVRAPLITADTPTRDGTPLGGARAAQLIGACFPDELRYEIRGGDAFVVSGSVTGTPALQQRGPDGTCRKPALGDPEFAASRLLQPRLRLGPYDEKDADHCPAAPTGWISHRIPHATEATSAPSCQFILNNGNRQDDGTEVFGCTPPSTSSDGIILPETNTTPLGVIQGEGFLPVKPDPLTETKGPTNGQPRVYTPASKACPPGSTDPACLDPWINREYELFSVLPLDSPGNQCVLTGKAEENNITASYNNTSPPNNNWNQNNDYRDDPNYDQNCTGFCRFPGDHTEIGGTRRIHYENAIGNLVMRVPRDPAHPTDPNPPTCKSPISGTSPPRCADPPTTQELVPPRWAVPQEGYLVSFRIYGGLAPYVLPAQTARRDDSSGLLAQSLKVAIPAFDGIVYLLDEGRSGAGAGLRGQIMRVVGALVDSEFLLR